MSDTTRTAIVTGAARGIGASVARRLSREGHAIAIIDLDADACQAVVDEIVAEGGTAQGFAADVSKEASVEAAVDAITLAMGPPARPREQRRHPARQSPVQDDG